MEDKVYRNKFAVQAALGYLKVAKKCARLDKGEELARTKADGDAYRATKEHKQLLEEQRKRDDDDEFKSDMDPKGFEIYEKFVSFWILYLYRSRIPLARHSSSRQQ